MSAATAVVVVAGLNAAALLPAGLLVDTASYGAAFGLAAGVLGVAAVLGLVAPETRWRGGAGAPPEQASHNLCRKALAIGPALSAPVPPPSTSTAKARSPR